jgi:hypothetical protein
MRRVVPRVRTSNAPLTGGVSDGALQNSCQHLAVAKGRYAGAPGIPTYPPGVLGLPRGGTALLRINHRPVVESGFLSGDLSLRRIVMLHKGEPSNSIRATRQEADTTHTYKMLVSSIQYGIP